MSGPDLPRPLVVTVLVVLATLLGAAPAAAETTDPPVIGDDGDISFGGGGASPPGIPGGGTWSLPPGMTIISYPDLVDQGGTTCIATLYDIVATSEWREQRTIRIQTFFLEYDRRTANGEVFGTCPFVPPADPTPAIDWAYEVLEQLPRPALVLEPDARAITGNTAYLETGRPLTFGPVTRSLFLGPLIGTVPVTLEGTGTYTVDWGDGDGDGTRYSWVGSPYPGGGPGGTVAHTWIDTGTRTVTTVDTWTVSLDLGTPVLSVPDVTESLAPRSLDVAVTEVRSRRTD